MGKFAFYCALVIAAVAIITGVGLLNTSVYRDEYLANRALGIWAIGGGASLVLIAPIYWLLGSIHEALSER